MKLILLKVEFKKTNKYLSFLIIYWNKNVMLVEQNTCLKPVAVLLLGDTKPVPTVGCCWELGDTKLALLLDVVGRWKVVKVTDQARTSPVPGRESKEVKVIPSATVLAALNITLSLELSKS